jgi:sortase A
LGLGYCLAVLLQAQFHRAKKARNFAGELHLKEGNKATPFDSIAPLTTSDKHGVIGSLEIPRIGVSVMVVEGADDSGLKRAAGHIPGTALPWEPGNVGTAGHRDTFSRPERSIRCDDTIIISTLQGAYCCGVVSTNIARPENIQVLYSTGRDSLTLAACFPLEHAGSAPKRFIVRAERSP